MAELSIWATAFVGCIVGSVVPVIHTELLVFGISALAPGAQGIALVLVATCGTLIGKTILYYSGQGLVRLPVRGRERIDRFLEEARQREGIASGVLFAAAAAGVPPFYIVTVAAGAIRLNLLRFILIGFTGRLIRFSIVVYAPHLIRGLVGG
jgi:membrane protein YqaA with SNARE-associated domain